MGTMASSLFYVLMLVLMVCETMGQGNGHAKGHSNHTILQRIEALENALKTMQETVVFSASVTDKTTYQTGNIYVFTNTLVNVGNGYDPSTGFFTAPIAGTYMFTVQVCNKDSNLAHVFIKVENNVIKSSTHAGLNGNSGTCATFTGISIMEEGDEAWVECSYGSAAFANDNWRWNMFSGVLL